MELTVVKKSLETHFNESFTKMMAKNPGALKFEPGDAMGAIVAGAAGLMAEELDNNVSREDVENISDDEIKELQEYVRRGEAMKTAGIDPKTHPEEYEQLVIDDALKILRKGEDLGELCDDPTCVVCVAKKKAFNQYRNAKPGDNLIP